MPSSAQHPIEAEQLTLLDLPSPPPEPKRSRARLEVLGGELGRVLMQAEATPSAAPAKPPARRKRSDGPAPGYQIKVTLEGSRPPIWRRLEVPGDVTLGKLHDTLQVAFAWEDSHMHVFETPFGRFGVHDPELATRSERTMTLEQVAPTEQSSLRYTYDFGDDWNHRIVVEKVLTTVVARPRCTGGKLAAPPDNCGGLWSYYDLVASLADPSDPQHQDHVEWLGLESGDQFDAESFDLELVNRRLGNR